MAALRARPAALLLLAAASGLTACASDPGPAERSPGTPPAAVAAQATDPGTDLGFGDAATLVWQPSADVTGEIELTVVSVAEQSPSVFDGWVRDDAMATARPYFVEVDLTNAGESDLAGQGVPLYLRDRSGALGAPWTLGGDFTACQSGPLPAPFAAGDEASMCLVYLVPDGGRLADLVFEPTEGYDPITWTGDVERLPGRRRHG